MTVLGSWGAVIGKHGLGSSHVLRLLCTGGRPPLLIVCIQSMEEAAESKGARRGSDVTLVRLKLFWGIPICLDFKCLACRSLRKSQVDEAFGRLELCNCTNFGKPVNISWPSEYLAFVWFSV